jgi:two-component system sensor histidine kinase YesM
LKYFQHITPATPESAGKIMREKLKLLFSKHLKIRERMLLVFLLSIMIPLVCSSFFYTRNTRRQALTKDRESQSAELLLVKEAVTNYLQPYNELLKLLKETDMSGTNVKEAQNESEKYFKTFTELKGIQLIGRDNTPYYTAWADGVDLPKESILPINYDIKDKVQFMLLKAEGTTYLILSVAVQLDGNHEKGILSFITDTEFLKDICRAGNSTYHILMDDQTVFTKIESGSSFNSKKSTVLEAELNLDNAENSFTIISIREYKDIYAEYKGSSWSWLYWLLPTILSLVIIALYAGNFSKRLNNFKVQIHKAAAGDFNLSEVNGNDEIADLYRDLNTMINSLQHLITTIYEEQVQKEKLNSRQKEVEFKMLASQINPHFLYNTLETIRMKARCNGEKDIEELVKMLAKIMRRNIQAGDTLVTLKSELDLVEYYLKIQQYRFGERIHFHINLYCDVEQLKIMPLIIQPIVENAFIHGLEAKEGEGEIRIDVKMTDSLYIIVEDDGIGMSRDTLEEIKDSLNDYARLTRSSIGLNNVNQRIKLLYGDEYGLLIESEENAGTKIIIQLPKDMS